MDMATSFSFFQLIIVPIILPLLPPAAVMFITDTETPAIEQNVEEYSSNTVSENSEDSNS